MHRSISISTSFARAAATKQKQQRVMMNQNFNLHHHLRRRRFSSFGLGGTGMRINDENSRSVSFPSSSSSSTRMRMRMIPNNNNNNNNNIYYNDNNNNNNYNNKHTNNALRMFSTAVEETDSDSDSDSDSYNEELGIGLVRHRSGVRNVAIIAHVDHGKTTLVDKLLRAGAGSENGGDSSGNSSSSNSNSNSDNTDRLLDCGDLEKERGITITSKVTRIDGYKPMNTIDSNTNTSTINLVDTPGHADFCGEVDRVLSLVDGVCLVVDAGEGPMAQTKYVLSRALHARLPIVVVLNKVDRKISFDRVVEGDTEISLEELMEQLGASEEQIRFSLDNAMFYASARDGWITQDLDVLRNIVEGDDASSDSDKSNSSMALLLDKLLELIPEPSVRVHHDKIANANVNANANANANANDNDNETNDNESNSSMPGEAFSGDAFSLAAVTVGYDAYLGRTCTGRITSGHVTASDTVTVLRRRDDDESESDQNSSNNNNNKKNTNTDVVTPTILKGLFVNKGISRVPLESKIAYAGDIVTLAGVPDSIRVGDTVTGLNNGESNDRRVAKAIHTPPLVPPTLRMEFASNNGPLAGTEGTEVTPSKLRNRLVAETDNNVTLTVESSTHDGEKTNVYARGELQLGILIEQMRREGFEMVISPPNIVTTTDEASGTLLEPYEEVTIDVDAEYSGYIVSALTSDRKGVLLEMNESGSEKTRLVLEVPSRGLLGFPSEAATMTRGSAIVNHVYLEDRKHAGPLGDSLEKGKLISSERGKATTYALASLAARGTLFVGPGEIVYPGMIIGETSKSGDMEVNPVRAKGATNIRTQNKDEKVYLAPPKKMTIEELIGYMAPDEMIEVTPAALRLRKAELDPVERKKTGRVKKQQKEAKKRR